MMAQHSQSASARGHGAGFGLVRVWAVFVFVLLFAGRTLAQEVATEAEIKAAYLLKFVSYVEWPGDVMPSPDMPIVLGVLGNDAIATSSQQLAAGLDVNGHPIVIRRVQQGEDLDGVHVLFVGTEATDTDAVLRDAMQRSVLSVTEASGARPPDSMINLAIVQSRVRFDVALDPVRAAGLRLSSRLLQVAERILGTP